MSGIVSFVNQQTNQEISVSYTTYNPLAPTSNNIPSSGQWYYYLLTATSLPGYYDINIQNIQTLYITLIGQGGNGPSVADAGGSVGGGAIGGGGGGGQVLTQTYTLIPNVTTTLSCTLGYQSAQIPTSISNTIPNQSTPTTYTLGFATGGGSPQGGDQSEGKAAVGGNGGNGGNWNPNDCNQVTGPVPSTNYLTSEIYGGAGGNGGAAYSTDGIGLQGPIAGIQGQAGISYNGATNAYPGQGTANEAPPAYTPITFADGLKGNLADGGMQNQSGNFSAIMVYYMESIDNGEDTDDFEEPMPEDITILS